MSIGEKLLTITEKTTTVYKKGCVVGYRDGYEDGKIEGIAQGQISGFDRGYTYGEQAQWNSFWDANQQMGHRTNYQYAYVGTGFSFANFYPKYDIVPVGGFNQAFVLWDENEATQKDSLKARLDECGVKLDTSRATSLNQAFWRSFFTKLPAINLIAGNKNSQVFAECPYLQSVEKVIALEETVFSDCFRGAVSLETVAFQGVIGQNGLNLSDSPLLTRQSILSLLNCLKNYAGTSTHTVTLGSVNLGKLTDGEIQSAAAKGWKLV